MGQEATFTLGPNSRSLYPASAGAVCGAGRFNVYEPQADGSLELVAVENLVFTRAWKEAGKDAPPSFHGVTYDTMADNPATPVDEAHLFEPHHDRHVWIYRENPNGMFAPFNPAVTCEHHQNGAEHQLQASGG